MATIHRNLSRLDPQLPSAADMKFGIVVSQWNPQITGALLEGAVRTLRAAGCEEQNIIVKEVPGTFELALGAQYFAEYTDVDGVIVLGCVIQGETRHFDYVCQGVTQGVTQLMLSSNMPVAFGVLTTENLQQAIDRAGGKYGNKGDEAAMAAIRMVALQIEMAPDESEDDRKKVNGGSVRNCDGRPNRVRRRAAGLLDGELVMCGRPDVPRGFTGGRFERRQSGRTAFAGPACRAFFCRCGIGRL